MHKLLSQLKELDIAKLLPPMDTFVGQLAGWLRLFLLAGPLVLIGLGAWYYYAPPSEANYSVGYRTRWSMSSVEVWRYAQRLAGRRYMRLGMIMAVTVLVISLFFGLFGPMGMAFVSLGGIIAEMVAIVSLHRRIDRELEKKFDHNGNPKK